MTVHDLRKAGYKVRVLHFRRRDERFLNDVYLPKGGETVLQVTTPEGYNYESRARCSDKERYNKRVGVQIALGRMFNKNSLMSIIYKDCA